MMSESGVVVCHWKVKTWKVFLVNIMTSSTNPAIICYIFLLKGPPLFGQSHLKSATCFSRCFSECAVSPKSLGTHLHRSARWAKALNTVHRSAEQLCLVALQNRSGVPLVSLKSAFADGPNFPNFSVSRGLERWCHLSSTCNAHPGAMCEVWKSAKLSPNCTNLQGCLEDQGGPSHAGAGWNFDAGLKLWFLLTTQYRLRVPLWATSTRGSGY